MFSIPAIVETTSGLVPVSGGAFLLEGESVYLGGRTSHLGSAALPAGRTISLHLEQTLENSKRELDSILAMQQAFHQNSQLGLPKTPLDEVALELEVATFRNTGTTFPNQA